MKNISKRMIFVIYLLSDAQGYLTSFELSKSMALSVRTIKSYMKEVKVVLKEHGAILVSKPNYGYKIEIENPRLFEPFVQNVILSANFFEELWQDANTRFLHIARTLISSDDYIKLDNIADALFLSRSAIQNEIKKLREYFDSYGIKIITKQGLGSKLVGSEQKIRLSMMDLVVNHYHKSNFDPDVAEFAKYTHYPEEVRSEIRHTFLNVLRNSAYSFSDVYTLMIAYYLIIMVTRAKAGYLIELDQNQLTYIMSYQEFSLIEQILQSVFGENANEISDSEKGFLATIFISWRNYSKDEAYQLITDRITDSFNIVVGVLLERTGIDFADSEKFKDLIFPALVKIQRSYEFDLLSPKTHALESVRSDISYSSLTVELTRGCHNALEDYYGCNISLRHFNAVAYAIYCEISSTKYEYKKLRLLNVTFFGKYNANPSMEAINEKFAEYIESNKSCELYEIRGMNQSDYDWVILDIPKFSYFYDIPTFAIVHVIPKETITAFYKQVIVSGYQYQDYLAFTQNIEVVNEMRFESLHSFLQSVGMKYCHDTASARKFIKTVSENEAKMSYNYHDKVVILFMDYALSKKNFITLFNFSRLMVWGNDRAKSVIVVSMEVSSKLDLKALENTTRGLASFDLEQVHNETEFLELIDQAIKNCINAE